MSVEGNEGFLEIPNASLRVSGNVHAEGIKLGVVELIPSYDLASVSNVGNTTSNTVQFTNPTTSLVASSNIVMLNTANTAQNVELSVGNRSNAYTKINRLFSDLVGLNEGPGDKMGACIAISGDGKVIVGSAPYDEAGTGAVYIFTQNSLGEWQRVQKVSDGDENFGGYNFHGSYPSPESLSLSNDGSILVVGCQFSNDGGVSDGGMAVIYTKVGATWSLTQKIFSSDIVASDYFGSGVDVSGDGSTIVVGAPGEDPGGTGNQGSAYIFQKVGGTWTQVQKLVQSDSLSNGFFGSRVRLSDDGTTLVVGAYGHDEPYTSAADDTGAAYIFEKGGGGTWSQTLKLYPTTASGPGGGGRFSHGLDISGDGNVIAAGAPLDDTTASNAGMVFIYVKSGGAWSGTPTQVISSTGVGHSANDDLMLGWSIALSQNGEHMVVGAIGDSPPGLTGGTAEGDAGAIHIYKRTNGVWTYVKEQRLGHTGGTIAVSGTTLSHNFGHCVAISHDGQIYLSGSPFDDTDLGGANTGSLTVYNEKLYLERTGRLNVNSNFIAQNPVFFNATSNNIDFNAGTSGTSSHIVFVFDIVNLNVGGGYDPHTGVFTAPISGYYKFDYNVASNNDSSARWYQTTFTKNGLRVQPNNVVTGLHTQLNNMAGQIVIDLEVGDTLAVAVTSGYISHNGGSFTGFYLSA